MGNFGDYFCCIHIFSAKLLICSQTFVSLKYIQKLEIWVRYTFNFHTNVRRFYWHASAAALIHRQQTLYSLFTPTKLSSIYRNKPSVTYTCIGPWWNVNRCLQFRRNSKLAIFFFTFLSRDPRKRVARMRRKTLKSWRGIYPSISSFLLCHGKAVNLLHLWILEWRNVKFL